MKSVLSFLLLCFCLVGLFGCDDDSVIEVEATIVEKVERHGGYYFNLEYTLEGFHEPLTAQESVKKRVFDQYQVGDTYLFKRPAPTIQP